ncbi:MAG: branched-chain amino acid ABC transporter permease, partial [Alphaproteobacteria bacterium]|nr:branched-chain amino acid ABC transporter permease [Alphaproteobacteria bacterium]
MDYFAQQAINAVQLGSIYALIALGYSMVYGVLVMINFAHGDVFMVSAFLCFLLLLVLPVPFGAALLIVM